MKNLITISNLLTFLRILMIPLFIFFFIGTFKLGKFYSAIVFFIASITDMLDGIVARQTKTITEFGIFFDQFADKLLVWTALLLFLFLKELNIKVIWVVVIILRDVIMLLMRWFAKFKTGFSLKTSFYGKLKSAVQMTAIVLILVILAVRDVGLKYIENVLLWNLPSLLIILSAFLSIVSLVVYIYDNRALFVK